MVASIGQGRYFTLCQGHVVTQKSLSANAFWLDEHNESILFSLALLDGEVLTKTVGGLTPMAFTKVTDNLHLTYQRKSPYSIK